MIRILSAAAALSLLAAPAFAADLKLNLRGMTPAAAYAKIVRAAREVCIVPGSDIYLNMTGDTCVADTVNATIAKIANPQLTNYAATRKELLQMARL